MDDFVGRNRRTIFRRLGRDDVQRRLRDRRCHRRRHRPDSNADAHRDQLSRDLLRPPARRFACFGRQGRGHIIIVSSIRRQARASRTWVRTPRPSSPRSALAECLRTELIGTGHPRHRRVFRSQPIRSFFDVHVAPRTGSDVTGGAYGSAAETSNGWQMPSLARSGHPVPEVYPYAPSRAGLVWFSNAVRALACAIGSCRSTGRKPVK